MNDRQISELIRAETMRQQTGIELIPSENYVSPSVLTALGSVFTNKYSEGYPGRRYYGGQDNTDQIETLAIERAKQLFWCRPCQRSAALWCPGQRGSLLCVV